MLSRMGLVMLAGKGLLGTRTGRALVGRLGRSIARTALAGLGKAVAGSDDLVTGRRGGQGGRMEGRHGGHGRGKRQDGLADAVPDVPPLREEAARPAVPAGTVSVPHATPKGYAADTGPDTAAEDICREAALAALAAHTVSVTRGRVRLRHPALRQAETHAPLREVLARRHCFTALTFSARTGSLLLEYDGHRLSHADFCEAALPLGQFLARCDQTGTH